MDGKLGTIGITYGAVVGWSSWMWGPLFRFQVGPLEIHVRFHGPDTLQAETRHPDTLVS